MSIVPLATERKCPPTLLVVLLAFPLPALAASLSLSAERITLGPASATAVRVQVEETAPGSARLGLVLGRADSGLGWRYREVAWSCPLERDDDGFVCAGGVAADGARGGLRLRAGPDAVAVELGSGPGRVALDYATAAPERLALRLSGVPVGWARPFLVTLWATAQPHLGGVDGELAVTLPGTQPLRVQGSLRVRGLGLDTPDGRLAAAGLDGRLALDYRDRAGLAEVALETRLDGGEVLIGSVYADLAGGPVRAVLRMAAERGGGWRLSALEWDDGGALKLRGSGRLDTEAAPISLELEAVSGDLGTLAARYLDGTLGLVGLAGMRPQGGLEASLVMEHGALSHLRLVPHSVSVVDPGGRFRVAGLDGALTWTAGVEPVASRLAWRGAALHGLELGAATLELDSRASGLRLTKAVDVDLLGGVLRLERFALAPPAAQTTARAELGLSLLGVDLGPLSHALGWPPFVGTLSGRLPAARYADGRLVFDGGLSMNVFGGSVAIQHLVMERPFGIAPSFAADIAFADLDLEPLTAAFGFGSITGRLKGRIRGLRLLDWTPVAFDAQLLSDPAWRGRRRISQRAVQDISNLGGSGFIAGIQGRVLRMFSAFRYDRLGLKCRLVNHVCRMDGIGSAGDGYTIVKGAGLPRIDVVGFQRRVDWPMLLERLKAATEGQRPVIE